MLSRLSRLFPFRTGAGDGEGVYRELKTEFTPKRGIYFGGIYLPKEAATSHFMIVGTTGSGKTLTLRMMMHSVLPDLLTEDDTRAVIFDVKQDIVSTLLSIGLPPEGILLLNPFDSRCWEWDMAKDVTGPDTAFQVASIIIPEDGGNNRYFSDAARDLLAGVMNVFIERGERREEETGLAPEWGLSDVLYATRSRERLEFVLSQTEAGKDLLQLHLQGETTPRSVVSTLRTKLIPFDVIAALWSQARHPNGKRKRISLEAFLKTNAVLVFGNNQAARAPIEAINRVLFQRLTELTLDGTESRTRRTWFFLDEARKLGHLAGLDDLMTNGRSKGACVVIGFQDLDGIRSVYGKEVAGEITSMPASFGVLKVSGETTPVWASAIFGEKEVREATSSYSEAHGEEVTSTYGQGEQLKEKRLFLPSQFRMIPQPVKGMPLCGYFCSAFRYSLPYYAPIPWEEVETLGNLAFETRPEMNFHPWTDKRAKRLRPWEAQDLRRLFLEGSPGEAGTGEKRAEAKSGGGKPKNDEEEELPDL